MIKAVYRYRGFIWSAIKSDFRTRFARSRFGTFWALFNPLALVLMYSIVLSAVLSAKLPGIDNRYSYAIYLMAGLLPWSLFAEVVTRCLTVFIENANTMKKLVFPKICLPIIISGIVLVNGLILLAAMIAAFVVMDHALTSQFLWLPFLMLVTVGMGLGVGLILGLLNVFARDIGQIIPIALQFVFWFTPIVYMVEIIPESYRHLMNWNPVYLLIDNFHNIMVFGGGPDWEMLIKAGFFIAILLTFSFYVFRRASAEMVDML